MWKLESQYISCMDGFKVLKLPYKQGHAQAGLMSRTISPQALLRPIRRHQDAADADATQYSMFVFLPDKHGGIATMVDVITAAPGYLYSVLPKAKAEHVNLQLPKFEINFDWDLWSDLRRLELSLSFSQEVADLRGMCENNDHGRPTFLNKVAHRAVVNVNEAGTEAAAVIGVLHGGGGPPLDMAEFVAVHPFTFFIMEERSGMIVFAGHVLDPTK